MNLFARIKVMFLSAVLVMMALMSVLTEGKPAQAAEYSTEDLAVLRTLKSDNPGMLADLDLDNPTIEDYLITADDGPFSPEVHGATAKIWLPYGASLSDEYSGDVLFWIQSGGEWRLMYLTVSGESLTSFDASRLSDLPFLSNITFNSDQNITSIALPKLDNLYALEIFGNSVTNVDVSNLTNLTAFRLTRTGVTSLTLPPSPKLAYFTCTENSALTELSGFYVKVSELEPYPDSTNVLYDNPVLNQYPITILATENGTITKNGGDEIYNGDSVTFTVKANSGYKLDSFQINSTPITLLGETYEHKASGNVIASAVFDDEDLNGAYDIEVIPTLDNTRQHLTLEFSFYVNEQKNDAFPLISNEDEPIIKKYTGVKIDIETSDHREVYPGILSNTEQYYADKVIAEYNLNTPLEDGNYLIRFRSIWNDPENEAPEEVEKELEDKYEEWLAAYDNYEGIFVNGGQPVSISSINDNTPPEGDDNTTVNIDSNSDGKVVSVSVTTKDGIPIPANVLFKVWLFFQNSRNQNVNAKAASDHIGPFMVESMKGTLNINVDNLKNPDGTKASIPAGSYVVKFADADEKYVGTTESITLKATGADTSPGNNDDSKGSSGGCNVGYGLVVLLLAGLVTNKRRKR
ncbi:MAG: hypothetical protein LBP21_06870 [Synergistaceae bacterium]|nr:hypothetical protein [Synergistaceae bacterium]